MSVVYSAKRPSIVNFGRKLKDRPGVGRSNRSVFSLRKSRLAKSEISAGNSPCGFGFKKGCIILFSIVAVMGILYLYQVNALASKGYEIKKIEKSIAELEENNKKQKIQEMELRSIYNIEKATENLETINLDNVSYVELGGAVAMK